MISHTIKIVHEKSNLLINNKATMKTKKNKIKNIDINIDNFYNKWKHLLYNPYYINIIEIQLFKKYIQNIRANINYSKNMLVKPTIKYILARQQILNIPKHKQKKHYLFLDLDETLIHTCELNDDPDIIILTKSIYFKLRPYVHTFLEIISTYYTIIIFTASVYEYANAIIDYLDPHNQFIAGLYTRESCMRTKNGIYIKDLRLFSNMSLLNALIIDDKSHSFAFQIDNGIPIIPFYGDKKDKELKYLLRYLIKLSYYDNLPLINKGILKLHLLGA